MSRTRYLSFSEGMNQKEGCNRITEARELDKQIENCSSKDKRIELAKEAIELYERAIRNFQTAVSVENLIEVKAALRNKINEIDKRCKYLNDFIVNPVNIPNPKVNIKPDNALPPIRKSLEECLKELQSLVGLDKIKEEVESLLDLKIVSPVRTKANLAEIDISNHMVFTGNPGTGKTTVARLIASIYKELGVLSKGHLVEVTRDGLVGTHIGDTAPKTKQVIEDAIGGVLFIDEAYSLTESDSKRDYGYEAVNTLLKEMEDRRSDLVVIVAGYTDKMKIFIDSNPGLSSRFCNFMKFEDYNPSQMLQILEKIAQKKDYVVAPDAKNIALSLFQRICNSSEYKRNQFGNARGVRNYMEAAIRQNARRIRREIGVDKVSFDELRTLTASDFLRIDLQRLNLIDLDTKEPDAKIKIVGIIKEKSLGMVNDTTKQFSM